MQPNPACFIGYITTISVRYICRAPGWLENNYEIFPECGGHRARPHVVQCGGAALQKRNAKRPRWVHGY